MNNFLIAFVSFVDLIRVCIVLHRIFCRAKRQNPLSFAKFFSASNGASKNKTQNLDGMFNAVIFEFGERAVEVFGGRDIFREQFVF
jgi:hypothetical protein